MVFQWQWLAGCWVKFLGSPGAGDCTAGLRVSKEMSSNVGSKRGRFLLDTQWFCSLPFPGSFYILKPFTLCEKRPYIFISFLQMGTEAQRCCSSDCAR